MTQQPYYPPPVVVNVYQNNLARPVIVRKKVNHWLHFTMAMLTGGLWVPIWVRACRHYKYVVR